MTGLVNSFVRSFGLKDAYAKRAADAFYQTLQGYNLLTPNNVLTLSTAAILSTSAQDTNIQIQRADLQQDDGSPPAALHLGALPAELIQDDVIDIVIPLKSTNKKAHLLIPENYTGDDLDRIAKFVEALK